MIKRSLETLIDKWLFKGQTILIYGARQVGKTTLSKNVLEKYSSIKRTRYFDCEELSVKLNFETTDAKALQKAIGDKELIVLDEAQTVKDIGKTLKIIHDHIPHVQVIATGSSSFDLANKLSEPLTGRALSFTLYPFSVEEISREKGYAEASSSLEKIMLWGAYPAVFDMPADLAQTTLNSLAVNYLYKDILMYDSINNPHQLLELLQLLALQVGNEVSYTEIGQKLGLNRLTVRKYIDLLEKSFVIFKLHALSRNKRNEIAKSVKIYFYDLGIRNALIQSFSPLNLRNDSGALWENFCITERRKRNQSAGKFVNQYFYRTYSGEEVDYVEEYDGRFDGYEFKFNRQTSKPAKNFLSSYSNASVNIINKDNWSDFLITQ
ncbi:MAG: ATP-binding protein [Endomicrobium sp.]|jgi:predicted AAA+ superfamily ATPase|nr:ATP-binding protein [Endomicrobium sp.]